MTSTTSMTTMAAAVLGMLALLPSTTSQAAAPPPPYDQGGGRQITLDDGRIVDRDTVYRFLPATLPIASTRISSPYGRRLDPFGTGAIEMHGGTDFPAPAGTPVYAAGAGTVTAVGPSGDYGTMVEVTHPFGFVTRYAHLSTTAVVKRQIVDRATTLGTVGTSGRSTGNHLYWETIRDGRRIDPVGFAIGAYRTYFEIGAQP